MSKDLRNLNVEGDSFALKLELNQKSVVWAEHGVKRITHKLAGSGKAAGEPKGFPPPH